MKSFATGFLSMAVGFSLVAAAPDADPAEHLMSVVRQADSVRIEFYASSGREEVAFTDLLWAQRLAGVLASSSYEPKSHCLCISFPTIRLVRKNEVIGTLSVHHGERLRAYAGEVSGDFFVGAKTGKAIINLANEKRIPANQSPEPTRMNARHADEAWCRAAQLKRSAKI